jgi:hypothetical protein
MLGRRGRLRPADLQHLDLVSPIDIPAFKESWLAALREAEGFVRGRPHNEAGCLYYSLSAQCFVCPDPNAASDAVPHFGRPGGVLPTLSD